MGDPSPVEPKGGFASIGHELDETAPVWRVYRDEVRNHDQTVTLDEWNKTLDVLLIFAGLFSAVVTSFLIATFPRLLPEDDAVVTAIYALAHSIDSTTMLQRPTAGVVKDSSLWINGLWFTSLFFALAVAFVSILAKQWLVEYNHRMADPPAAVDPDPEVPSLASRASTQASVTSPQAAPAVHATPARAPAPLYGALTDGGARRPPLFTGQRRAFSAPTASMGGLPHTTANHLSPTSMLAVPARSPSSGRFGAAVPEATPYAASPTASLTWARRRRFFFAGFDTWHIPVLVTHVLPFLLHLALFLFLVGLVVFLWTLNDRIALAVSVLTGLLFSLYLLATVLPVIWVACPTATPWIRHVREIPTWLSIQVVRIWGAIVLGISPIACPSHVDTFREAHAAAVVALRQRQIRIRNSSWIQSQSTVAEEDHVRLESLRWLILVSGSESAIRVAFQALGAISPNSEFQSSLRTMTAGLDALASLGNSLAVPSPVEVIRAVRSELLLGRGSWRFPMLGLDLASPLARTLRDSHYPDAMLICGAMGLEQLLERPIAEQPLRSQFAGLYDITVALLIGTKDSPSYPSTVRLLLDTPDLPVPAFACLCMLLLAPSSSVNEIDRARIFNIYDHLQRAQCSLHPGETCDATCIAFFFARKLDVQDPVARKIVPAVFFRLLVWRQKLYRPGVQPPPPIEIDHRRAALLRNVDVLKSFIGSDWGQVHELADLNDILLFLSTRSNYGAYSEENSHLFVMAQLSVLPCYLRDQRYDLISRTLRNESIRVVGTIQHLSTITHQLVGISGLMLTKRGRFMSSIATEDLVRFLTFLLELFHENEDRFTTMTEDMHRAHNNSLSTDFAVTDNGLAPYIAAFICVAKERGCDVDDWIEIFIRTVTHIMIPTVYYGGDYKVHLRHLAQHCVQLDPAWCKNAIHLGQKPAEMETWLMAEGPCPRCIGPSVWPSGFPAHTHVSVPGVDVALRTPTATPSVQDPSPSPNTPSTSFTTRARDFASV